MGKLAHLMRHSNESKAGPYCCKPASEQQCTKIATQEVNYHAQCYAAQSPVKDWSNILCSRGSQLLLQH